MNSFNFDTVATYYRDAHSKNIKLSGADSTYYNEFKVLKSLEVYMGSNEIQHILDFGCGDGLTETHFEKHLPYCKITGLDASQQSLQVARARNLKNSRFIHTNKDLPEVGHPVDLVFVANVFHHLPSADFKKYLEYFVSLLSSGGEIHIYEHNPLNPATRRFVSTCVFDVGVELVFPRVFCTLFKEIGVKNVKLHYLLFFPRHSLFSPLIPFEKYLSSIPFGGQYLIQACV